MNSVVKYILVAIAAVYLVEGRAEALERLVLHFDVNNTIIAEDRANDKSLEDNLNSLLAERYVGLWEKSQETPMSYYDYVHRVLFPGPKGDKELKKARKQYLSRFLLFLEETHHPLAPEAARAYQALKGKIDEQDNPVFMSFFALLGYLEENDITFSVVLRSYGMDLGAVVSGVESYLERPFFDEHGAFREGNLFIEENCYSDRNDIYAYLTSGKNLVVKDDWLWWSSHGTSTEYGKPYYVDDQDSDLLQIFFDDNAKCYSSSTNVINAVDRRTGLGYPVEKLAETGKIVRVDTFQAILEDAYFIDKVKAALEKHQE